MRSIEEYPDEELLDTYVMQCIQQRMQRLAIDKVANEDLPEGFHATQEVFRKELLRRLTTRTGGSR